VLLTKLDRLARSTHDLQNILKAIQTANADFKVLDTPSLDTTNPYGKLLFDILRALAEFERSLIKSRTSEGRVKANANWIKFARKPTLNHHQKLEAINRRDNGEILADIAKTYNVDPTTIGRLL
jgi:DNA invertase Pin-like site-specific DNA recombinase